MNIREELLGALLHVDLHFVAGGGDRDVLQHTIKLLQASALLKVAEEVSDTALDIFVDMDVPPAAAVMMQDLSTLLRNRGEEILEKEEIE